MIDMMTDNSLNQNQIARIVDTRLIELYDGNTAGLLALISFLQLTPNWPKCFKQQKIETTTLLFKQTIEEIERDIEWYYCQEHELDIDTTWNNWQYSNSIPHGINRIAYSIQDLSTWFIEMGIVSLSKTSTAGNVISKVSRALGAQVKAISLPLLLYAFRALLISFYEEIYMQGSTIEQAKTQAFTKHRLAFSFGLSKHYDQVKDIFQK